MNRRRNGTLNLPAFCRIPYHDEKTAELERPQTEDRILSDQPTMNDEPVHLIKAAALVAVVWTLLVGGSLYWNLDSERQQTLGLANMEAVSNLSKDVSFRSWIASHGGVYVPVTEDTPPNPYLTHLRDRDVTTTDGRRLTLMNPAYVIRQVYERHSQRFGISGKITSLKLLNPNNAPDAWETKALKMLEAGNRSFTEEQVVDGKPALRSMIALIAEPACLKCHAQQGYQAGEVRGGLTATISLEPYLANERHQARIIITTHAVIWLMVCLGIFLAARQMLQRTRKRLQAELALKDSQQLFKTVSDYAGAWVFWRNPDGSLRYVSPSSERISGYSVDELVARPSLLTEMVYPDDRHIWEEHTHGADADQHPKPFEFRILTKQGELRWISHNCRSIYDEDGKFIGVRGSNSDVTDRHHKDELMMLQSRHAAMGEMVGNIAHQWRQPLTTLGLMAQNLRIDFNDRQLTRENLESYTQQSQQLIQEMSTTIDDFRNFFRPNKEKYQFCLKQSVASALNLLGAAFTSHGIEVSIDVPDDLSAYGYPNEYSQVLLNILTNAKDALVRQKPAHGRIEIRGHRDDGQAVLSVTDNGGGIPDGLFDKVFEPYFSTKPDGTGIGLYISRIIIERNMGGRITVCNTELGAEFSIYCPIAEV